MHKMPLKVYLPRKTQVQNGQVEINESHEYSYINEYFENHVLSGCQLKYFYTDVLNSNDLANISARNRVNNSFSKKVHAYSVGTSFV